MNPQYAAPGQPPFQHNNNQPSNQYPPSSELNGVQTANYLSFTNGQNLQSSDVTQKFQNLNLNQGNGPQFGQLPPGQVPQGQLPPGANFPPNFVQGGRGPNQNRPSVSGAPMTQGQFPPPASQAIQSDTTSMLQTQPMTQGQFPPPTSQAFQSNTMSMPQRPPVSSPSSQVMGFPPKIPSDQHNQPPHPGQLQQQSQLPPQQNPPGQPPSQLTPGNAPVQQPPISRPGSIPPQDLFQQPHQQSVPPKPNQTQEGAPLNKQFLPPSQGPPSMNFQQFHGQKPQTMQPLPGQIPIGTQSNQMQSALENLLTQKTQGPPNYQQGKPPQSDQKPSQFGQVSHQSGKIPSQLGQGETSAGPEQSDLISSQHEQASKQLPQHPGQLPPQQGNFPPQGQRPMQPNHLPQHDSITTQSSSLPPQPGQFPSQPGQLPPQPGQLPPQPGQLQPQPGQLPPQPGHLPPQPGQLPLQQGQLPQHPGEIKFQGQLTPLSNQPISQSGQLPLQPGTFPLKPGQFTSQQGSLPPQQGQLAPNQFQLPLQQNQMPPQGQKPSQPAQLQPQPGTMPQPGSFPPQPNQMQPNQFPSQSGQYLPQSGINQPNTQQPPLSGFNLPGQQGFHKPEVPASQAQFPGQYNQQPPSTMTGLPHMPPSITQANRYTPGTQAGFNQPGFGATPPVQQQYPGMPPMPGQHQFPNQQPYPGQQPYSGQQPYQGAKPPLPGQPPYPGQQPYSGQQPYPGQQPSYPGQQQQQEPVKRLDPDQMPSPVQVMADDQANRGGLFVTNEKGMMPPLVSTDFTVDDRGNSSPRFIRSSMYNVPATADLLKQTAVPFCLAISPLAETVGDEHEPPLLDFAASTNCPNIGPVRCVRCKAYMCPAMKFTDAGRHFKCAFCKATTEVAMEYTQHVNSMLQYGRTPTEMAIGTYEILATKEYCRNNKLPNPPAIIFVIDVSYNAVKSGLVSVICANIKNVISLIPRNRNGVCPTRVGFITYCSTVHFYNIKGTLGQPQMLSVCDVADVFVPLLEGFLVRAEEAGPVLDSLLQQIPHMFADNKETEIILLPAVQAGLEALKAAETSGQLIVFHTSLPTLDAPGKLSNREDRKLLGTEKEKQVLNPQTTVYNELGQALSAAGVCCELFIVNNSYVDLATIGQLARLTGGGINKYTYFTAEMDGQRLVRDLRRVVSRPTGYDAVMRVRTSTGVRATDFYGHFFMSNTTDVELAAIDADKSIAIEIKHDDKLTGEDGVYIQAALLYTHRTGQRRLRIINLSLNVTQQLADVYRSCELDTIINYLSKQGVMALRENSPRAIREGLTQRCARSLATYRKHCASPSSVGQLVLPESMKLMPLYISCLLRSDSLSGGPDITCDDRSAAMYRALTADVSTSLVSHYPRLLPLHRVLDNRDAPLPVLRASIDKMQSTGVYLLENGLHMLLWIGSQASPDFLQDVFGVQAPAQVDPQVTELPVLENETSEAVRAVIQDARRLRKRWMRLTVMRQHDKLEAVLRHFLVEDRGVDGSASYVDFLCHVHKEIRAML